MARALCLNTVIRINSQEQACFPVILNRARVSHGHFVPELRLLDLHRRFQTNLKSTSSKRKRVFSDICTVRLADSWEKRTLVHDDVQLVYHSSTSRIASSEKPTFVFLHGLTSSGTALIPLFSEFSSEFKIVLPSARGHGQSQPIPPHSFTMEKLVNDSVSIIERVAGSGAVILGGHSMGAATAARVAKFYPEKVKALVLEDPPWLRMPGDPILPHGSAPQPFSPSRDLKALSDSEFQKLDADGPHLKARHGPYAISDLKSLRQFDADAIEPTFRATDDDINEAVTEIAVPTLLQTAGGPLGVCRPEVAAMVLATWKLGERFHFASANHIIHDPPFTEEWIDNVKQYLRMWI